MWNLCNQTLTSASGDGQCRCSPGSSPWDGRLSTLQSCHRSLSVRCDLGACERCWGPLSVTLWTLACWVLRVEPNCRCTAGGAAMSLLPCNLHNSVMFWEKTAWKGDVMHYRELFVFQIKPHGPVWSCLSFLPASLEQGNIFASCCQIQWACRLARFRLCLGQDLKWEY